MAIVKRTALLRRLIRAGEQISKIGYDGDADISKSLSKAEDIISSIRAEEQTRDFRLLSTITDVDAGERIMTGFDQVDELLGGLGRSNMIVLAARLSIGKSALAHNIALNVALAGRRVAIFSLKMSRAEVSMRIVACATGIPISKLQSGRVSDSDQRIINATLGRLQDLDLFIDDTRLQQMADIHNKARELQVENGVDFIVVDCIQLIEDEQVRWQDNRTQEMSEEIITRYLKIMARDLNVPVLVLSHIRASEKRDSPFPQLSDLEQHLSDLEQHADVVIFIHREDKLMSEERWHRTHRGKAYPRGVAELHVLKNRHGETGMLNLSVNDATCKFSGKAF